MEIRDFMARMREAFHLYCGFDIGLCRDPDDFCYKLRSRGHDIERANSFSQGEKWRLNPKPDWSDPRSVHEQLAPKPELSK